MAQVSSPTTQSNDFLTALAAQERKVLELREELQKAEGELEGLKKQWAMHESQKKRESLVRVEQMRPVSMAGRSSEEANRVASPEKASVSESMGPPRSSVDVERRKAMHAVARSAPAPRKVFSGSKHTRTLSLLSPGNTVYNPSFSQPSEHSRPVRKDSRGAPAFKRTETLPEVSPVGKDVVDSPVIPASHAATARNSNGRASMSTTQPREVILKTGKQMASDFREGLWTFIEDLRQATVGDESVNGTENRTSSIPPGIRKQSSKSSLKGMRKLTPSPRPSSQLVERGRSANKVGEAPEEEVLIDVDGTVWTPREIVNTKKTDQARVEQSPVEANSGQNDDGWDAWDSPQSKSSPRWSGSSGQGKREESEWTVGSSPRTSTRYVRPSINPSIHHDPN